MPINCYAALKNKEKLEPFTYNEKALAPDEVEVKVSHCGICYSDIHLIDNDWGTSKYPLVPGHEIVGVVTNVGANVVDLKPGTRVGIGWQADACHQCEWCHQGAEHWCGKKTPTAVGHFGGFAEKVYANRRFVFPIPDALSSENAAPLLCGGVTVFSPLCLYDVRPTMRVGVIGIGGLGHLALQFLNAFGCDVTAFSTTSAKEQEAKKFGAAHFIATNEGGLTRYKNQFDFILSTVHADLNWDQYLGLLRPKGTLCIVGAAGPMKVSAGSLIGGSKRLVGSTTGGSIEIQKMLEFAARHHIQAQTELMPLAQVNEAIEKVRANQARYRVVLEVS